MFCSGDGYIVIRDVLRNLPLLQRRRNFGYKKPTRLAGSVVSIYMFET